MKLSPSTLHFCLASIRNKKLAIATFTALSLLGWSSDASAATVYWNQAGTGGTWTSSLWGTSTSGPFTGAWATSNDVVFGGSAAAAITFATTTVGNITVNTDTTVSQAGTLTWKVGGSTVDVAAGKTLTWTGQTLTTTSGLAQIVTKNGAGIWNMGAQGTALATGSSFTLNAGEVIVSGSNNFGGANAALNINGGKITSSGTRAFANSAVTIGGDFENSGTGNATYSGTVALGNATRTISNTTASGSRSYTGIISGAVGTGLTFSGAGLGQTFIGNTGNTFTGPITITGGEVIFNNNGALGATTSITLDGGRLTIGSDSSGTAIVGATIASSRNIYVGSTSGTTLSVSGATGVTTYNGVIANKVGSTGVLGKQGAGTLILGGVNTYTGETSIGNGTVKLDLGNDRLPTGTVVSLGSSGNNLGALDLNGRNQQIAGLVSTTGTSVALTKNTVTSATAATLEINVANGTTKSYGDGTTQNSGVIGGLLALTKSGSGTQVLGDANTYSGTTTISNGVLNIRNSAGLGATTAGTTVANLAALELQNSISVGAEALTLNGTGVSSGGALRNISGNNSYGGLLALGSASRINSDSGTLSLTNTGTVSGDFALTVGGAGDTVLNSILGTSTGTLTKDGAGALILGGASTYTGATSINNGTLKLTTSSNRLPTGTVVSLGQASSGNLGTLDLNGLNQQIAGLASTTGTNATATKNTVTSTAAATLDINVANGATSSYGAGTAANSGAITGAISLKKSGLGTQTLGDTNTYTGTTTIDAGKLVINGSISTSTTTVKNTGTLAGSGTVGAVTVNSGGFIAPGNSPGILNTGNIILEAGSTLGIEIDGATVATQYDRLNVTGSVSLAGLLSMTMSGSYAPANGTLFFILANDGTDAISGTFSNASVNGGTYTFGSQQFQISYAGDTTTSSFTGGNDVVLQAVPEPASLLLGAVAILTLLRRRR